MRDYLQTIRYNDQIKLSSIELGFEVQHVAQATLALLTTVAVLIDGFGLTSILWQRIVLEETWQHATNEIRSFGLNTVPLYLLASWVGICVSSTCRQSDPRLAMGWVAGFLVASFCWSSSWHQGWVAPIPCWGLLAIWFSLICSMTILRLKRFSTESILLFLSVVACLFLWGRHGDLNWLKFVMPNWQGLDVGYLASPSVALPLVDWKSAFLALLGGFMVAVVLPCILVLVLFKDSLKSFGLTIPVEKRSELFFRSSILLVAGIPLFYIAASNNELQSHYPYVRSFSGPSQLIFFELSTLLFYACVEFIFRGYLLFGVEKILRHEESLSRLTRASVAILISSVPYIVWHLEKPAPELLGALIWAVVAGVSALQYRTVVHLIVIHWLWNVCLDLNVMRNLDIAFTG